MVIRMKRLIRRTASQGAELERVAWAVPCPIRLWKSVENSKTELSSGGTQEDEIGNTKFGNSKRKPKWRKRLTHPFNRQNRKGRPPERKKVKVVSAR
jgi:hypothetical protein